MLNNWWLSQWTANTYKLSNSYYLGIFVVTMVANSIFLFLRFVVLSYANLRSSSNIFKSIFNKIIYAPLSWFDVTPIGRIIQRLKSNVDEIDFMLSYTMQNLLSIMFSIVGSVIMISFANPIALLFSFVILLFFIYVNQRFLKCLREIKRFYEISYSPVTSAL